MINVNMSSRNFSVGVDYTPFKPMTINKETEDRTLFLIDTLYEEVSNVSETKQYRKIKQLKRILKTSLSILGLVAGTATRTLAATTTPTLAPITPALIFKWGLIVALTVVAIGVVLSMVMLATAGIYRMFRKRKEADMWTTDILKGLIQVLIAVPTVFMLYYLAQLVFGHLPILKSAL